MPALVCLSWLWFSVHPGSARVIVMDPGHGGPHAGTHTISGVSESLIVLGIAKSAREYLEKDGLKVVMTRDEDLDLTLDQRVQIANQNHAAVFISIHSNYAPLSERKGFEAYILAPDAEDEGADQLVQLENATNDPAEESFGGRQSGDHDALGLILDDLSRMTAHKDSALLAREIQDQLALVPGLGPNRGLHQAPFRVLRAAKMPAVLVEIGYLSHAAQGTYLASPAGQKIAGQALARGVMRFIQEGHRAH